MTDFLVEIGTEELPPKALARLGTAFADEIANGLAQARLTCSDVRPYFSPRRLAVWAQDMPARQEDVVSRRLGPALKAAYAGDGKPTKAALGFAASCGVPVDALEQEDGRIAATVTDTGQDAKDLLPDIVRTALSRLPIPKRMRWGAGDAEFVRPVHWVVMLLGDELVDGEIFGVRAARTTFGHRFHAPGPLEIPTAAQYATVLEQQGRVRVNDRERTLSAHICAEVVKAAEGLGGTPLGLDGGLPDEVAALVEWPVPVVGRFDKKYLALPDEVLVTTLMHHQRYFPVSAEGKLLPAFITFANIESKDPATIQRGNERVVVPRLEDAMFFWEQDRRTPLAERTPFLEDIAWQKDLGSVGDKVRRVAKLAGSLAGPLGADDAAVARAVALSKCDLLTAMVGEFPELQGVMGRYYALHDDEDGIVATAIEEHYLPRFAGDGIPKTAEGRVLAIADRADTLAAVFATGARPTGDKDPFALRRAALGLLRILLEARLELDLRQLFADAVAGLPAGRHTPVLVDELFAFTLERLKPLLAETGTRSDVFHAVAAVHPTRPLDFVARVRAVESFRTLPEADALAAADKRIGNILKQADAPAGAVDDTLLSEPAEQALWEAVTVAQSTTKPLFQGGRYADGLTMLAELREPVDTFFESVMVMADDPLVRSNRVALLASLQSLFREVADIGELQ